MELIIGSHVGFNAKTQLMGSLEEALGYEANTFMIYTGSTQSTLRSEINSSITLEALEKMKERGIDAKHIIVHAPYIINLANREDEEKYMFYVDFFARELDRVKALGLDKIVLHPGSAVRCTRDEAVKNIADGLNMVLSKTEDTIILLEYMAGKGNEVGISQNFRYQ